ncbi:hypothetical protein BGZ83_006492 [Gryganskiella cystojenkinii]|nr:hypothetical protein BGZ83_006492 [Gryganskiella cystojenkinii]
MSSTSLESLLLEISHFELGLSKSKLVKEMAERERIHYEEEQQQILDNIQISQAELEDLARDLEEAKRERAHKIQYNELAMEVNKFPSRATSEESIAALKVEIQELEYEANQQIQAMAQRKQQFGTVLQSLRTMQESIQQEQLDEVKRLFLKRGTQNDEEDEEEGFVDTPEENKIVETTLVEGASASSPTATAAGEGDVTTVMDGEQQEGLDEEPPMADGLERVLSSEGHHRHSSSDRSRRGSDSPRDQDSPSLGAEESSGVFVVDLQSHSASTPPIQLSGFSSADRPDSATPPSRSQTGTPQSSDQSTGTF